MKERIEGILGSRDEKKIRYKTWAVREGSSVGIRHHNTTVILYDEDGTITMDCAGWRSHTTKERLNNWLPPGWGIYQKNHVWYLHNNQGPNKWTYKDGIQITPDGEVIGTGDANKLKDLTRDVLNYVNGFMEALEAGEVEMPSAGDCWDCAMRLDEEDGETLGEWTKSNHLLTHMEEEYYVPSLLMRAMEVNHISSMGGHGVVQMMEGKDPEGWYKTVGLTQAKRCLKSYMYHQLGLAN